AGLLEPGPHAAAFFRDDGGLQRAVWGGEHPRDDLKRGRRTPGHADVGHHGFAGFRGAGAGHQE
ncbi:unnamed protein product, partial [Amoebophrya sp. A120]